METTIELSELRKRKIFVATPMFGGVCHGNYTKSVTDLAKMCQAYDIEMKLFFLYNESLIPRARNYAVDEFMRSEYTHLMFIDADITFDPNDVLSMAALMDPEENKYGIMVGAYPKKTIAWEKIKRAVDRGFADDNPNVLGQFVGDYVFNPSHGQSEIRLDEPVEVLEGGTGFMMITRESLEEFSEKYPDYSYIPDHVRTKHFDGSREIHQYFQAEIDPKSKRYLSEDYWFCHKMKDIGIGTWLCPWMHLEHTGTYTFGGSLAAIAELGVTATADPNAIVKMKR